MPSGPPLSGPLPPPTGFSGWGGGAGPQGLSNSPGLPGSVTGVQSAPGRRIGATVNQAFYVILRATGVPQQAPAMMVPPGAQVLIRAHNGTNAGNTNLVTVDHQPEMAGSGDPITPDSEIGWPTNSTINIWVVGTAGDGIRVSVQQ